MENNANFEGVVQQIATILETLIEDHGFTVPIRVLIEGANRSSIVGSYRYNPDGLGLQMEIEQKKIYDGGFRLPIDIEFQDSATDRAAGMRIERGGGDPTGPCLN
jgi:hypothetical protein